MVKIAIAVDGTDIYPIYRENGMYHIDMGGSMGMSEPLDYPSDTKAISDIRKAIEQED